MGKKLDRKIEESVLSGKGGQVVGVNGEVFDWDLTGKIQNLLVKAISSEFGEEVLGEIPVLVTVPTESQWGDYTSNIGMQLSGKLKQSPLEIANKLQYRINEYIEKGESYDILDSVSVSPPGYINFEISSTWLNNLLNILVNLIYYFPYFS